MLEAAIRNQRMTRFNAITRAQIRINAGARQSHTAERRDTQHETMQASSSPALGRHSCVELGGSVTAALSSTSID